MGSSTKGRRVALFAGLVGVAVLGMGAWLLQDHVRFWYAFESLGLSDLGHPEYRHRATGIVFVALPGGETILGSPQNEKGRRTEEWRHEVTLSPFLMAKYELGQGEWEAVMGTNPSHFKKRGVPVEGVTWEDCREFCRRTGLDFPSEAQWEYACRAGTSGPYSGTGRLDDMGWHLETSQARTQPVGIRKPNDFGLHDMHGNVLEWCLDAHDPEFYQRAAASGLDPVCTSESRRRVCRGGCWYSKPEECRSAARASYALSSGYPIIGFRPCYRLP